MRADEALLGRDTVRIFAGTVVILVSFHAVAWSQEAAAPKGATGTQQVEMFKSVSVQDGGATFKITYSCQSVNTSGATDIVSVGLRIEGPPQGTLHLSQVETRDASGASRPGVVYEHNAQSQWFVFEQGKGADHQAITLDQTGVIENPPLFICAWVPKGWKPVMMGVTAGEDKASQVRLELKINCMNP